MKICFNVNEKNKVQIEIYTLIGELAGIVNDSEVEAGEHSVYYNIDTLPAGIYIVTMKTAETLISCKMCVVR